MFAHFSSKFDDVTNKTGMINEYSSVKEAEVPNFDEDKMFTFVLYNYNNTSFHNTVALLSGHRTLQTLAWFRTNFNTEETSLRSV